MATKKASTAKPEKVKEGIPEFTLYRNRDEIKSDVVKATRAMIGRGAPTAFDDMGFNKFAYSIVVEILSKPITTSGYLTLIKQLIRHRGQVSDIMGEFAIPEFSAYAKELNNAFPFEFNYDATREEIGLEFRYNEELKNTIKLSLGAYWEAPYWRLPVYSAFTLIKSFEHLPEFKLRFNEAIKPFVTAAQIKEKYPAEMAMALEHYERRMVASQDKEAPSIKIKQHGNKLILAFDYHAATVAAIKSLPHSARKYLAPSKEWEVDTEYHDILKVELDRTNLPIVYLTDLFLPAQVGSEQYIDKKIGMDLSAAYEMLKPYEKIGDMAQYIHQIEGEAFMLSVNESVIQADDVGLGKTIQTILTSNIQRKQHGNSPVLVVLPATLKKNWVKEITMWLGKDAGIIQIAGTSKSSNKTRTFHTIYPAGKRGAMYSEIKKSVKFPDTALSPKADWLIVNYDILHRIQPELEAWIETSKCKIAIFDEAHYLKNMDSKRTKAVLGYKKPVKKTVKGVEATIYTRVPGIMANIPLIYALTGTPSTGRNKDFWPLIKLIRHPLAENKKAFMTRYCQGEVTRFGADYNASINTEELVSKLSDRMIQRMKQNVLTLPPKTRQYKYIDIDLKEYWDTWDTYRNEYEERTGKPFNEDCAHLTELNVLRNVASKMKIPAVKEYVADIVYQKRKIIVFTGYRATAETLLEEYGDRAIKIVGGMTADAREAAVNAFQNDPSVMVAVCNFQAAAVGITLTAASDVLMADLKWLPTDHFQAEGRAYRIGQLNNVNVMYFIGTGTHEEVVQRIVEEKAANIEILEKQNHSNAEEWKEVLKIFFAEQAALREAM